MKCIPASQLINGFPDADVWLGQVFADVYFFNTSQAHKEYYFGLPLPAQFCKQYCCYMWKLHSSYPSSHKPLLGDLLLESRCVVQGNGLSLTSQWYQVNASARSFQPLVKQLSLPTSSLSQIACSDFFISSFIFCMFVTIWLSLSAGRPGVMTLS